VHLSTLAFLALGAWVILLGPDGILSWILGGVSLAVGCVLRPRLGRLPADAEPLDRSSAPELYDTAGRVADRVGVPRPKRIAVRDLVTGTSYDRVGLARTPVLVIGLPLWLALPPKLRAVLLATAYARLPTGGERVVGEALHTLESWHDALLGAAAPLKIREEAQTAIAVSSLGPLHHPGTAYEVMGFFGRLVGRVLGGPVLVLRYVLTRLARAGESGTLARQRALALRAARADELAELKALTADGGYLAPMQAAALRGESVAALRQTALARFRLTADGVLTTPPDSELLGLGQSDRIDEELRAHYTRAIRGFGLIS
jgi:hypothetical protein